GVDRFRSKLNKDVSFTFEKPGIYVYKCTPHYGLGMVGVVVVGDSTDGIERIRKNGSQVNPKSASRQSWIRSGNGA
ncbi:MAG: hypothetical protein GWO38_03715, partial [Phycisphaerae bacterium]|nr:hypothetical protein [Phycisphaerae bacterium]NIX26749.1 hypothetical protein [Phycisphaerae bacterium]